MNILVTGGCGFIGSHLIDYLLEDGHQVYCIDDLSLGRLENIDHNQKNSDFKFEKLDILDEKKLDELFKANKFDCVFHLAANSDILAGTRATKTDLNKNFLTTFNILDSMKENNVKKIVFSSTSAIYGEVDELIGEDHGPLQPISLYGASKLSAEAYISAYAQLYSIQSWIIRFPNVVGERATHGAIYDFIKKLKKNPLELEVLGDGTQIKPYLYVKDLVEGIIYVWKNSDDQLNIFNLGTQSATSVKEMAEMVVEEMGLDDSIIRYTGGDRGWNGDVPRFEYDLSRIHNLGWKAKYDSTSAVRLSVKNILKETDEKK